LAEKQTLGPIVKQKDGSVAEFWERFCGVSWMRDVPPFLAARELTLSEWK